MNVELTLTFSAILGIAAVISPGLTSLIDNRYKLKLKRLELEAEMFKIDNMRTIQSLEKYLSCLLLIDNPDTRNIPGEIENYQQALACALPYLPKKSYEWVLCLNLESSGKLSWSDGFTIICKEVREEIERLRKWSIPLKSKWYKRHRT